VDRYHVVTSIWSLRQQAIVAESRGWVVFFDYTKGKPANLVLAGGVYADLYNALKDKCTQAAALAAKWDQEHPKKNAPKL
jgi:hypothetical protein